MLEASCQARIDLEKKCLQTIRIIFIDIIRFRTMNIDSPLLALIFLLGSCLMTGITSAMQSLGKTQIEELCDEMRLRTLGRWLFIKKNRDFVNFSLIFTKNLLLICYAITAFTFLFSLFPEQLKSLKIFISFLITLSAFYLADFSIYSLSLLRPKIFFKAAYPFSTLFLILSWPLSSLLFKLLKNLFPSPKTKEIASFRIKDKILEILHDSEFAPYLDPHDQKLILSVVSFKERIAREVMVPRIDMFCLSADTTIKEAAKSFLSEGYSRIPIYRDSVDNIIGVLYYKDVLNLYAKSTEKKDSLAELSTPIEDLVKPVLYTPETKKISHLLQEFRSKQIHLAIVVDEYGGTEGIVTIEDILEELVGEIADEYDYGEEALFSRLPSGEWIVDAKMGIIDIEEELGIKIPQSPEYDTIGGYIFHRAGTIPSKGWRLHHDDFDLEVLSSDERSIEKIRITPLQSSAP